MSSKPPTTAATEAPTVAKRPSVIALNLKGKSSLYAAWMPMLKGGGLFMQSNKPHQLGDDVLLVLQFLDEPSKIPIASKIVWINPPHAAGNRPAGVGVCLPDNESARALRKRIETVLAPVAKSDRATYTV
jgi:type IV pilus assembly protein PilZ